MKDVASEKRKDRKLGLSQSRVWCREQAEGFSLEAQSKALHDYAALHSITIVQEFAFVESAKEQGRKHFNDMIAHLCARRKDGPLVPDPRQLRPAAEEWQGPFRPRLWRRWR